MADIVCLHAKEAVEEFCRRNPFLHVYALGDLDDFFWPHTTWYALREGGAVRQLVLFYNDTTMRLPTLMAYAEQPVDLMRELLRGLLRVLPKTFYAHLTPSVADVVAGDYHLQAHGDFHKMGLVKPMCLAGIAGAEAVALSASDCEDLQELYAVSYPSHWFVPRMLQTGFYYGVRRASRLVSVAGVHVYAPEYKVAALGNIATHPDFRGQGLATAATARLCQELLRAGIEHVGLNVRADNASAVACYQKLGFEQVADYGEYTVDLKYARLP